MFQTGGISLDFKLVTGTLSGVFIQRAFLHVDDARTKLRAPCLSFDASCVRTRSCYRYFCIGGGKKPNEKKSDVQIDTDDLLAR